MLLKYYFPKSLRILKRVAFKELARKSTRFFGSSLVIDYFPTQELKLGITVPRQFGNAVRRNRFKRLVREAFRMNQHALFPCEMNILPSKNLKELELDAIEADLLKFCHAQQTATKGR